MGELVYNTACMMCRPAFYACSYRFRLHLEHVPQHGPVIIAATHLSPFDIPCLMAAVNRPLDFVASVELFRNRWVGGLFRKMHAFELNRGRPDAAAVRTIRERIAAGRAVVIFPEGRIRKPEDSILSGKPINPNLVRIARMTGVPVVPCVMLGTGRFLHPLAWLPIGQTRYAVAFGVPVQVSTDDESAAMGQLRDSFTLAYEEARLRSGIDLWG